MIKNLQDRYKNFKLIVEKNDLTFDEINENIVEGINIKDGFNKQIYNDGETQLSFKIEKINVLISLLESKRQQFLNTKVDNLIREAEKSSRQAKKSILLGYGGIILGILGIILPSFLNKDISNQELKNEISKEIQNLKIEQSQLQKLTKEKDSLKLLLKTKLP
jgi:hypothetical protein